jgi:hypothetical protein
MGLYTTIYIVRDGAKSETPIEFTATKAGRKAYFAFINYLHRNAIAYVEVLPE